MDQANLRPFLTHWDRLCKFLESETFPPGLAEDKDAYMQAHGLLEHYNLQHSEEAKANKAKVQQSTSRTNKIQNYPAIRLPSITSFAEAAAEIIAETTFEKADTIIVLTDTEDLSSTRILKHFGKLGPLLYDRTTVQGPYSEQWTIAFHRIEGHDHKIHCTWAAVFLIEALITAVPWKHYVLQDHDDAPLALYEIQQLVNLIKAFHLPYFSDSDAHPGLIIMNEESTPANAGQVFFPARETRKQTAQVNASWIHKKYTTRQRSTHHQKIPSTTNNHSGHGQQSPRKQST